MIASVQCASCGAWHSVAVQKTKDEVNTYGVRVVEYSGRLEPCPNTRVEIALKKEGT